MKCPNRGIQVSRRVRKTGLGSMCSSSGRVCEGGACEPVLLNVVRRVDGRRAAIRQKRNTTWIQMKDHHFD